VDELGSFLQTRRARVRPESVGLRGGTRRRVPGLRREELAQLAGISVEYYQRLEQGRATGPSDEVLDAIARALALDAIESAHLRSLARPPRRSAVAEPALEVRPELHRMLDLLDRVPALIVNDLSDVLAVNLPAARLFPQLMASDERNLARHIFLSDWARSLYGDWEEIAAATAGQLRLVAGRCPGDARLASLVAELSATSEDFRRLWAAGDVDLRTSGSKVLRHPDLGELTLHYENFDLPGDARRRLVTLTPEEGSATEAAVQILAETGESLEGGGSAGR
jgi:transcriptional regulator with XRE-family HTH domain